MNSPDVRARLLNAADPSRSGTSWAAGFTAGIDVFPPDEQLPATATAIDTPMATP
jgi:hypothetical protein